MIPFFDLASQQKQIRSEIQKNIAKVLEHGQYILGPEVSELEEKLNTQKNSLEVCKAAFNTIYDNCSDTDLIIDICDMQLNKTLEAV